MHVVRTPYGNMIVGRNGRPIRGAMQGLGESVDACIAKCPRQTMYGMDVGADPNCVASCNQKSDTGFTVPGVSDGTQPTVPVVGPPQPPPAGQECPPNSYSWLGQCIPNPIDDGSKGDPIANILTPPTNQPNCPSGQQLIAGQCIPNPMAPPAQDTACPQGSYSWFGQCIPNPVAPPPKGNDTCQNGTVFDSLLGGCSQSPPFAPPQGQPPLVTSDGCQPGQYKLPFLGCQGNPMGGGGTTPQIRNCPDGTAPVNGKCAGGKPPNPPNALCPDGKPANNGKCAGGATAYTCPDNSYPVGGRCPGGAAPVAVAPSNNTTMWILLGVGVVVVGGGAYLLLRKKKPQTPMAANRRRRHYRRY